ncbi:glycosyltransferase family 9 protein [Fusobacterium russii]|uniref:glycosyltransferase family 9 protein n=1 Tax=Fusobacterium russii TaxID=854 RepID=UPI0003A115CD|nr:glycosyltransferase family 9 protein [Fusobacterium russii]
MEIKRIIVSRTDKIGDLILSIPSFYMLKKMYPCAELVVLVRKYNYDIVANLPYIDRIIKIDDYTKGELLEKIPYFKADVFIALYNDDFVASLAKASKAKIKIGPLSKLNSFFTYNKGVLQKRSKSIKNEGEYNLDLVKKLNPNRFKDCYELNNELILKDENRKVANLYFSENNIKGKCLVVNPFIGGSAKNIRDEQYAQIIKRVKKEYHDKLNVIITCYISDEERAFALKELINEDNVYVFANSLSILNIASIIEKADVYLGGSTGPTHIAGALKKKIVAIYPRKKTQHPIRWGVLGNSDVKYIIPDEHNKRENYKNPHFDKYTKEIEDKIVNSLIEALK